MPILYLVATPIGNLEDITLRAIRILREADIVLCEDTRRTGMFLKRLNISTHARLLSYYDENEEIRIPRILNLLVENKIIALVSNAGTPEIADPGFKLVKECLAKGIRVAPIPGASSLLAALTISGLPPDKFLFLGFLPLKKIKRQKVWQTVKNCRLTTVFFESPYRLVKTIEEVYTLFGDIPIAICRELTKIYEEVYRGNISQIIGSLKKEKIKGEIVVIIKPA